MWDAGRVLGSYSAPSLEEVGFIHCSSAGQVLQVANAFYQHLEDPVVLWIDTGRLVSSVRWETPEGGDPFGGERFPHVYGAVDLDAVVRVTGLVRGSEGEFTGF
jgi:uncharacterized protein (DUF952 family)